MHQEPANLALGGPIAGRLDRTLSAVRASADRPAFAGTTGRHVEEMRRLNLRLAALDLKLRAPLTWEGDQA